MKSHAIATIIIVFLNIYDIHAAVSNDDTEVNMIYSRHTRSVSNYDLVSVHSICQPTSEKATEAGVSDADKTLIVNLHNRFRSEVTPTAANMLQMKWNDEVALIAQKWAEHCDLTHDSNKERNIPARYSAGQNLAMGARDFEQAINLWQAENSSFQYGGSANSLSAVGHFTQVTWATTNLIGCGFAKCGSTNYHVCNYAPAGNSGSLGKPYKSGQSCADCSSNCDANGKLCVCTNTCWHGTKMDPATCTCQCLNDMYVTPSCKLDCDKNDPSTGGFSCSGSFGQTIDCTKFPTYCPHKCKYCPEADYRVVEKAVAPCLGGANNVVLSTILLMFTMTFLNVV